jgi:hypothetical protein
MALTALNLEAFVEYEIIFGGGTDDVARHVASCAFIPSGGTETRWKGGTPDAKRAHRTLSDWTCQMRVAQDFTATGLAKYLFDNEGETIPVAFQPVTGGPTWYADLVIAAPQIGGDIDTYGEATLTHTCVEKPTTVAPTP